MEGRPALLILEPAIRPFLFDEGPDEVVVMFEDSIDES